jgi:hypothetical protein
MKRLIIALTILLGSFYGHSQTLKKDYIDDFTGEHIKITDSKYIAKGKKWKIYWSLITIDSKYSIAVSLPYSVGGTIDGTMLIKFKDDTIVKFDHEDININYGDSNPNPNLASWSAAMGHSSIPWGVDVYNIDREIVDKILSVKIDKIRVVMGNNSEDGVVSDKQQERISKMIYLVTTFD